MTTYSKLIVKLYSFNGYNYYFFNGQLVASYEKTSRDTEGDLVGFSAWYSKALLTDFSVYELN